MKNLIEEIKALRAKGAHDFSIEKSLSYFINNNKQATTLIYNVKDLDISQIIAECPFVVDDRE